MWNLDAIDKCWLGAFLNCGFGFGLGRNDDSQLINLLGIMIYGKIYTQAVLFLFLSFDLWIDSINGTLLLM